jgi:glycosyl-4,4'-diaponeurosporenoate acyltransferase
MSLLAGLPIWHPADVTAVVIDVVVLLVWNSAVGYTFHRLPVETFDHDRGVTRLRSWERDGRFWVDVVRIRRWKGWLPDAGDLFAGGFSKRRLSARDPAYLQRFVAETRRAELVHWIVPAIVPVFFLWNPWWLAMIMVVYAVVANVPCLVTQRYNRARLERVLTRVTSPPR